MRSQELDRNDWKRRQSRVSSTLIRLRDWARELTGDRELCIDDILTIKEDES